MARILVVDDERVSRKVAVALCQRLGHQVEEAASGEQAIELLTTSEYQLCLSDLEMGEVGGNELVEFISASGKPIKFVLMTSADQTKVTINPRISVILAKPLNIEEARSALVA